MDASKMVVILVACVVVAGAVGAYFILSDDGEEGELKLAYLEKSGYEEIMVADGKGYFDELDFKVTLNAVSGSGADCVEQLMTGNVDIASTGEGPYINALALHPNDVKIIGSYSVNTEGQMWVGRIGSGIVDPSTLSDSMTKDEKAQAVADSMSGKKFGILDGSSTHNMFKKWCAKYGLEMVEPGVSPTTTKYILMEYPANGAALVERLAIDGGVDAIAASNPFPINAIDKGYGYKIGSSLDLDLPSVAVFVTTKAVYDEKTEMIENFLRAMKKATDFMSDPENLEECLDICAPRVNWTENAQEIMFSTNTSKISFDDDIVAALVAGAGTKVTEAQIIASCPNKTFLTALYA
jgi:ABC-type nitrate/sulfonate/bicarbonate transport systems, periplasmic components